MHRLLPLLLLAASCSGAHVGATHIAAYDLQRQIGTPTAPPILDVRSGREYAHGHVPGAIHFPFWAAFGRASTLELPCDRPVVVYCEHGPRAGLARLALRSAGFERVLYLEGHMSAWRAAGRPLETGTPGPG